MRRYGKPETGGDADDCRRVALALLTRREHSRSELERKLGARGFAPAVVSKTLDALEGSGALAATRYTESFIRARLERGQGPVRLKAELASRGIDAATIAAGLEACECDWVEAARRARVKRFGATAPAGRVERAKQARFLEYRGYTGEQIRAALDRAGETD